MMGKARIAEVSLAIAGAVVLVWAFNRPVGKDAAKTPARSEQSLPGTETASHSAVPSEDAGSAEPSLPGPVPQSSERPAANDRRAAVKPQPQNGPSPSPSPAKEPIKDPLARAALSLVGDDPEAEQYWVEAINDPGLSAHERQDLIEDLNEDGFPDPKHPSLDDLPLIVSRLDLIEQLAPDAMDKVNADAFAEAYKDLANMYARLTQQ